MAGWICLHREIQNHWIYSDANKFKAWVDLLLLANIDDKKFFIKSQLVVCKRGQLAVSQKTLEQRWNWSRNQVRHFLELLENDAMIIIESNHLTSIITICNYREFQDISPTKGTSEGIAKGTSEGTAEGKQLNNTTRKQLNNKNNCDGFDEFWDIYDKKIDRKSCEKIWAKLKPNDELIAKIINAATSYVNTITDKQYQKHPKTWLNNESWNNDLIINTGVTHATKQDRAISAADTIFQAARNAFESRSGNGRSQSVVHENDRNLRSDVVAELSYSGDFESQQS